MAYIQTIIETVFGYPATAIIKDLKNLSQGHKPVRNAWVLMVAGVGATLGGVLPTVVSPSISQYVATIVQSVLPLTSVPSYVTGNIILVYFGVSLGLIAGKYSAQAYYQVRYHDSNSGHLLYAHELADTRDLYSSTGLNPAALDAQITAIFKHLVAEIRRSKLKDAGTPLEPISLAWTKPQLKGVLSEFMAGNADPYDFFFRLAHLKQNFLSIRLQERVSEIDRLLEAALPRSPEVPDFGTPYIRPSTPRAATTRHRRKSTVSEPDLHRHPKLHRYLTQLSGHSSTGFYQAQALEEVRTLLLSKEAACKQATGKVPPPLTAGGQTRSPQPLTRGLRITI